MITIRNQLSPPPVLPYLLDWEEIEELSAPPPQPVYGWKWKDFPQSFLVSVIPGWCPLSHHGQQEKEFLLYQLLNEQLPEIRALPYVEDARLIRSKDGLEALQLRTEPLIMQAYERQFYQGRVEMALLTNPIFNFYGAVVHHQALTPELFQRTRRGQLIGCLNPTPHFGETQAGVVPPEFIPSACLGEFEAYGVAALERKDLPQVIDILREFVLSASDQSFYQRYFVNYGFPLCPHQQRELDPSVFSFFQYPYFD